MEVSGFSFDDVSIPPERQIGYHVHQHWEVSYVISGGGSRTIGDVTEPVAAGEIVLVPPMVGHVWRFDPGITDSDGNIRNISFFFSQRALDGLADLFSELREPLAVLNARAEAIAYTGEAYDRIRRLLVSMRGLTPAGRLPVMIELLLALSDVSESRKVGAGVVRDRIARRCEKVRIYCACNLARDIRLDDLARYVGMNRSSFCTFMRRHMGMSLSHYVNALRLERAREKLTLLRDRSISEIAMDCGFVNVTYFNRLFKARFGHSPGAVRRRSDELGEAGGGGLGD